MAPKNTPPPLLGPPSLLIIVQSTLKRCTHILGDLGDVPFDLIADTLALCTPSELQTIEEATLHGVSGRDLSPYTWPLWWQHCTAGSLPTLTKMPSKLPPLPTASAVPLPRPDVAPAHYRLCYEDLMRQIEERRAQSGKKFKELRSVHEEKKASRSIQIIAPIQNRKKGGGASKPYAKQAPQLGVKARLMKKLNVGNVPVLSHPVRRETGKLPPKPVLPSKSALAGLAPPPVPRRPVVTKPVPKTAQEVLDDDDIFGSNKRRKV